jgi:hypothetical protein
MFGLILTEGAAACFILLLCCVVGIANGPLGMVFFYEKDVQQRIIAHGILTKDQIDRQKRNFLLFGVLPFFIFVMIAVYGINGARGFLSGFWQICVLLLIEGLFDRLFIDGWWVGKTKAWLIPKTEDLMPYIPDHTRKMKWMFTLIGSPVIALVLSGVMTLIITLGSLV